MRAVRYSSIVYAAITNAKLCMCSIKLTTICVYRFICNSHDMEKKLQYFTMIKMHTQYLWITYLLTQKALSWWSPAYVYISQSTYIYHRHYTLRFIAMLDYYICVYNSSSNRLSFLEITNGNCTLSKLHSIIKSCIHAYIAPVYSVLLNTTELLWIYAKQNLSDTCD